MSEGTSTQHNLAASFTREPLIPFALIGGLLFAVYGFTKPEQLETIEITPQTLQALEDFDRSLRGGPITEQQRQTLIDSYVEDEVLMREAFRRGLEKKDSGVRKRLLLVMRSSLDEQVPEPTRAEVEAFFRENSDRYAARDVVRFDHVFFPFGDEPADMDAVLEQLRGGADYQQMGEPDWASASSRRIGRQEIAPLFGVDFADQVFELETNEWSGPLESVQGVHCVRLLERKTLPASTFDQLEDFLRQDLMFKRRRDVQTRKIAEMKKRYRVVMKDER